MAVVAQVVSPGGSAAAGGVIARRLLADRHFTRDTGRWLREGLFGTTPTTDWRWLLISSPHSGTTFDLAHTCGTSAATVLGCACSLSSAPRKRAARPDLALRRHRSMTLTLYSLHVLVLSASLLLRTTRCSSGSPHVMIAVVAATLLRSDRRSRP